MGLFDRLDVPTFQPQPERSTWRPQPPPSLEGIHDIELDVETDGLQWWKIHRVGGISICKPDGTTQYLPMRHQGGNNLDEQVVKEWARRELRGKHITNISTKFDVHHMREWGVDLEAQGCTVADVSFDAALLDDHREKMSLAALCEEFLPETERKVTSVQGVGLDPARMMEYPADMVAVRGEADVRQVHLLKQVFAPRIAAEGLSKVQFVENQCIYPVCEMEKNGVYLNVELLHQWHRECEQRINALLLETAHEVGFSANPDASHDWVRVFEKFGIPVVTSKRGTPTFTDDVLDAVPHPTIQKLRRAGKLASLKSKYLTLYKSVVGADGRLHFNLHQLRQDDDEGSHGTITGRFSSSDVNIQQVSKTKKQIASHGSTDFLIRQLFVPKEGLFLSADGKQIEYRIFAHYANSPRITQAFAADPHLNFHQLIFSLLSPHNARLTYEGVKNINFMRIYGGGIVKLALMMGFITKKDAEELQEERDVWRKAGNFGMPKQPRLDSVMAIDAVYNQQLPEVKPLLEKTKRLAEERGFVRTMLGRRGRFVTPAQKRFAYKAFNVVGQGGGADLMKIKLIDLHRFRKDTGFTMRACVHDQVIGDVPDEMAAAKVGLILDQQAFKLRVPILWDVKTGVNWKECD